MKCSFFILAAAMAMLGGCASEAQRKDIETDAWTKTLPAPNADYGKYPANYEQLIKANFSKTLKDPDSARYGTFSKPRKEHVITNANGKVALYGYSVCASVNAKNSYGGYTGNHAYWFFIRDDQIVRKQDIDSDIRYLGPLDFGRTIYRGHSVNCADGDAR